MKNETLSMVRNAIRLYFSPLTWPFRKLDAYLAHQVQQAMDEGFAKIENQLAWYHLGTNLTSKQLDDEEMWRVT